ncbi:Uncharacterised protein [Sphingobacterium spiritivorum]|jgi:hypothetical protein|uniref:Uncharacterized protein n=1 Tax=Sphingobacterium spiritivorum TaxID=258 RepID=A0A380CKU7_SPHSI|nr:Uncharacterised protein [Sphingobacterium spiritivorum]SUJ21045.1 Uncharacterised protein [Sphingobacterium spiritivorum]
MTLKSPFSKRKFNGYKETLSLIALLYNFEPC